MQVLLNNPNADLAERAAAAKYGDLAAYARAVHNYNLEPYQLAWEEALNSLDRTVIVCPPDTFKSTTVQLWVERAIGLNPNIRILWLMNAGEQAEKRVMTVGQTIANNPVYRKAFNVTPDPDSQWTKSVLFVKRDISSPDPTLMGAGLNGAYQGLHFDIIVIDDPTNQEDPRSPTTMEMQRMKLRGVVVDRLVEGGRIMAILTRWGENDLVPGMVDMGFTMIHMPLVGDYPWGPTISNKRFPPHKVEIIRRDKTEALFQLTYMGNAGALSGNIIKISENNYWDSTNLPKDRTFTFMAVDPAATMRQYSDPSCIGMGLLEPTTGRLYLTDMWVGRVEIIELENEIVKRAKQTSNLLSIGVETIGFQTSLMQSLRRRYGLPVKELPYRSRRQSTLKTFGLDRDKMGRAIYVASKFSRGEIFIPKATTSVKAFPMIDGTTYEAELQSFPNGKHDDRMDVTAFLAAMADSYISSNKQQGFKVRFLGK